MGGGLASPCEKLSSSAEPKVCFFFYIKARALWPVKSFQDLFLEFCLDLEQPFSRMFPSGEISVLISLFMGKNNPSGDKNTPQNQKLQEFKSLSSVPAKTVYDKVNSPIYTETEKVMLILLEK